VLIFYSPGSAMFALGQEVIPFKWNTGRECVAAPIVLSIARIEPYMREMREYREYFLRPRVFSNSGT
jgi:hypothetical protein